jgi:histidinol-phosphate aminotransferase
MKELSRQHTRRCEEVKMSRRLLRPSLESLEPYIPGKPAEEVQEAFGLKEVIKLASNENPWGPSPMALEAMREELSRVSQYPEGTCRELRRALAVHLGVQDEMITVSNGADNILMMIVQAFAEAGEEVVMAKPTFPVYRTATLIGGGVPVEVPLRDFTHDLEAMGSAVGPRTKVIIICNPNNPTGTMVTHREVEAFLSEIPDDVLLVLDEVYGDFVASIEFPDALALIQGERPVISVRSFSKLYGLAGLRVGYAVGPVELIQALNRVREPFPVNRLAQVAALAALQDDGFSHHVLTETARERSYLSEALERIGLRCIPSHTNFLFVDLGTDAQAVFEALLRRGIIIRPGAVWGSPTCCRITVGTPEQNERLVHALGQLIMGDG